MEKTYLSVAIETLDHISRCPNCLSCAQLAKQMTELIQIGIDSEKDKQDQKEVDVKN